MPERDCEKWHERIQDTESGIKELNDNFKQVKKQVSEIHKAFLGNLDGSKRGFNIRVEILENGFKAIKWAIGVIYIAFISAVAGVLIHKISGG